MNQFLPRINKESKVYLPFKIEIYVSQFLLVIDTLKGTSASASTEPSSSRKARCTLSKTIAIFSEMKTRLSEIDLPHTTDAISFPPKRTPTAINITWLVLGGGGLGGGAVPM